MPQITIRTSPEIYIPAGTSNLNPYYKECINQILSIAPDLTVKQVSIDNSSAYEVTLKFMGNTEVGIRLYCSGRNFNVYTGYWDKDGAFKTITSAGMDMFLAEKRFKVSSYGVDGTLVYVMPCSEISSASQGFTYGMFTSTANASPQYCVQQTYRTYTYPGLPAIPFGELSAFCTVAPTKDNYETVYLSYFTAREFVRTEYTHALLPAAYYGYTATRGFLNIKWGGKYNIYHLYNVDGAVWTRPGDIVTINGVDMLSPGVVTVIE